MDTFRIRPAVAGACLPDPDRNNEPLVYAEEGVEVRRNPYWLRHVALGDAVVVEAPAPEAAPPPAPVEAAAAAPEAPLAPSDPALTPEPALTPRRGR